MAQPRADARHQRRLSLAELLVVLVVVAVLVSVAMVAVVKVRDRAQQSACDADWRALVNAQEAARAEYGAYVGEAQLVAMRRLPTESSLHDIDLADSGEYVIEPVGACSDHATRS